MQSTNYHVLCVVTTLKKKFFFWYTVLGIYDGEQCTKVIELET